MHNIKNCIKTSQKCSNYGGKHYASDKNCPHYIREAKVMRINPYTKLPMLKPASKLLCLIV